MTDVVYLYIGIFAYLFMGLTMYVLGTEANRFEVKKLIVRKSKVSPNWYFVLSILFFALMCGLRYRTGADCESYVNGFEAVKKGILGNRDTKIELLYTLITGTLAQLEANRIFFLGLLAFIEISLFYFAIRTRSYLIPFAGLVLILGPHFLSWNNGIRQVIASLIFVYATVQLVDKKQYIQYCFWIIIAFFMHRSALILFPLMAVTYYNMKPRVVISLIALFTSLYIGSIGLPTSLFSNTEQYLNFMGYEDYGNKIDYFLGLDATVANYGPRRIILLINYIIIIIFSLKMDNYYEGDHFYRVAYLFFLIYACSTEAFLSLTMLFSRPFQFLMPFLLIMTAYLLNYLKSTKNPILWLAIFFSCSYTLLNAYVEYAIPGEYSVYKFIFYYPQ